jgi:hypothetical protein
MHRPSDALGELGVGRLGPAVLHQVEAEQQPAAAHVADAIVALLQGEQAGLWPEVKSRIRRPSASVKKLPAALSAISGENAPP